MKARIGDWLLVPVAGGGGATHRGEILAVRCGGEPPYRVRWLDNDREALVFPGPGAEVISAERQSALDRARQRRIDDLQALISSRADAP